MRFSSTYEMPDGRAHVVLEHLPAAVGVAHEVAAGHVAPDAAGRPDPVRLAGEVRAVRTSCQGMIRSRMISWAW